MVCHTAYFKNDDNSLADRDRYNEEKKTKYRLYIDGKPQLLCDQQLYQQHVKGDWQSLNKATYQSKSVVVELNLTTTNKEPAQWVKVKLLFVRSINEMKQNSRPVNMIGHFF
jgi:hypothetical protein